MTSLFSRLIGTSTRPAVERVLPPFGRSWVAARISASMAVRAGITIREHLEHRLLRYMQYAPQDGGPRVVFAIMEDGEVHRSDDGAESTAAQLLRDPSGFGGPGAGEDAAEVRSLRAQHAAAQEHATRELDDAQRRLEGLEMSLVEVRSELAEQAKATLASIGSGATLTGATTARGEHTRGLLAPLGPTLAVGAAAFGSLFVVAEATNLFTTFADYFGLDLEPGYATALAEQTTSFVGVASASLATSLALVIASFATTRLLARLAQGGTSVRTQVFDGLFALGSAAMFAGAGWAVAALRQSAGEGAIALLDATSGAATQSAVGVETWAMWTLLTAFGGDLCLKGAWWAYGLRAEREEARRVERRDDAARLEVGDRLAAQRAFLESKERDLAAGAAAVRDEVRRLEERMREAESRLAAKVEVSRKYRDAYAAAVLAALAIDREQYLLAGGERTVIRRASRLLPQQAQASPVTGTTSRGADQSGERPVVSGLEWPSEGRTGSGRK